MKKTKIITSVIGMCIIASLFAGCNGETKETAAASRIDGGQTQISVENSETQAVAADGEYAFSYNGYKIVPGSEAEPALAALGDDYERMEVASCAYQGVDIIYSYPGFTLYAFSDSGVEYINVIEVEDSLIDCGGVSVGDSVSIAKNVYGTPAVEDDFGLVYRSGKTEIQVSTTLVQTPIPLT